MCEHIRYRHLRTKDSGCVTVCAIMNEEGSGKFPIRLGFAFCSPRDQFSKKLGRIKSYGRAQSGTQSLPVCELTDKEVQFFKVGFTAGILSIIESLTDSTVIWEKRLSSNLEILHTPQWLASKFWPAWKEENPKPG